MALSSGCDDGIHALVESSGMFLFNLSVSMLSYLILASAG